MKYFIVLLITKIISCISLFAILFMFSNVAHSQCIGFPSTVEEIDCSLYPSLTNNATLSPGDTVGLCPPDANEVVITGVDLVGGTIRICGNISLSANFNSGTVIVQCGSTLRIPGNATLNNGVKIINYGTVEVNGNLLFQNIGNAFYNENDSSRLIVTGNLVFPQNNGQNAYLKNRGYIEIGGLFNALDGGFCCFSDGAVLQCNNLNYIMNCGGPSNRFTYDGSGGRSTIRYQNQANIKANMTTSANFDICQATGSSVNFFGCGSFGAATVVPDSPIITDPGSSNTNCIGNCFTTLPVELIDFQGACSNGSISLNWSTASESNNAYFAIEKSINGIEFNEVGRIEGSGNTSSVTIYAWQDNSIEQMNYYRLRQVDFDGYFTIHKVIAVESCLSDSKRVYPNPCNDWINVLGLKAMNQFFSLHDCTGKAVLKGNLQLGNEKIFVGNLVSGVYHLNVEGTMYRLVKI